MKFRARRSNSQLPEVNLVPMMDVLMTVLTFFIIVSMTLTGQQILNVNLPQTEDTKNNADDIQNKTMLVVGLSANQEISVEGQTVTTDQLAQQMQSFLSDHPDGVVMLKADRGLTYRDVNQLLKTMRDIGGNRVVLGFEQKS